MEFLNMELPSWMNLYVLIGLGLTLLVILSYFGYHWYTSAGSKSPFSDMGQECNPQIENACGKDANCHPDESGEKGICFPKQEEFVAEQQTPEQQTPDQFIQETQPKNVESK